MADDGSASNPRDSVKSSGWNAFTWIFIVIASFIGGFLRRLFGRLLPKKLDRETIDTSEEIERTSSMASSSCGSWRYDVFPSFRGEDVRNSFLSHLLKELNRKLTDTFIDHGIERSRPIAPELKSAIRESRIAIVVFSKNYASSTWCLNELVDIHKCYNESAQMVFPIFYNVDPSEVRKQKGDFGKVFRKTCKGKTKDQKQKWIKALENVANLAGHDLKKCDDEAAMIEAIANDVSNKLFTPSNNHGDLLGIEAHLETMNSKLCLESEEARMVGILGPSGIGKTTIGRELYRQLSSKFHHQVFVAYKRNGDLSNSKLYWVQQFLSKLLGQNDLRIEEIGALKQRLKHKKVLIFLDDVDDLELLNTLVGETGWFGPGSRIIVITQDSQLLKAHKIDLIYEVAFPSEDLALKMFCRSAFGQNSPLDGFMELAVEVVKLAGNLPLGLSVLGSSLKGRGKDDWMELLPSLRNDLNGDIEKVLRVGYDRLHHRKDKELFLCLAFANLFNGKDVTYIRDLLGDSVATNTRLKILAEKSLIRITPEKTVEMHNLLQKLGKEIVRAESIYEPGKRRFLEDAEDIANVLTNRTGTETVRGIHLNTSDLNQTLNIHKEAFKGMHSLQFLIISNYWRRKSEGSLQLLEGLDCLPSNLKLLKWDEYPSKCLPFNFKTEFLVELKMEESKIEKLWEGTQPIGRLKRMILRGSRYLKEIPDLSKAIHLEELHISECESLVTLPSSIQNAIKLRYLDMENCTKLESLPTLLNLESLECVNLRGCFRLRNFPQIYLTSSILGNCKIEVADCLWNKNLDGVDYLDSLMRSIPSKFRPEHIRELTVKGCMLEKLWEGVQSLGTLWKMDLSECENLKEFPDLSKATNLYSLKLNNCKSLVKVPSTIGNLQKLVKLKVKECTGLEVLPTDVNLPSLKTLDLSGCKRLRSFPQISWSIGLLNLNDTAIVEVPCCIENFSKLTILRMRGCKRLKNISPNIFRLRGLEEADFSECVEVVTALGDASAVETTEDHLFLSKDLIVIQRWPVPAHGFMFNNCFNLDGDAQELILRSYLRPTILPGGRVPKYFTHQSSRTSLTVTLPQSSLSQKFLGFKACVVLERITNPNHYAGTSEAVRWHFRGGTPYLNVMLVAYLKVCWHFRGSWQSVYRNLDMINSTDHLVLFPLKFQNIAPSSELDYNDVEFEFNVIFKHSNGCKLSPFQRIKGCGIRILNAGDGSKKPVR